MGKGVGTTAAEREKGTSVGQREEFVNGNVEINCLTILVLKDNCSVHVYCRQEDP